MADQFFHGGSDYGCDSCLCIINYHSFNIFKIYYFFAARYFLLVIYYFIACGIVSSRDQKITFPRPSISVVRCT